MTEVSSPISLSANGALNLTFSPSEEKRKPWWRRAWGAFVGKGLAWAALSTLLLAIWGWISPIFSADRVAFDALNQLRSAQLIERKSDYAFLLNVSSRLDAAHSATRGVDQIAVGVLADFCAKLTLQSDKPDECKQCYRRATDVGVTIAGAEQICKTEQKPKAPCADSASSLKCASDSILKWPKRSEYDADIGRLEQTSRTERADLALLATRTLERESIRKDESRADRKPVCGTETPTQVLDTAVSPTTTATTATANLPTKPETWSVPTPRVYIHHDETRLRDLESVNGALLRVKPNIIVAAPELIRTASAIPKNSDQIRYCTGKVDEALPSVLARAVEVATSAAPGAVYLYALPENLCSNVRRFNNIEVWLRNKPSLQPNASPPPPTSKSSKPSSGP